MIIKDINILNKIVENAGHKNIKLDPNTSINLDSNAEYFGLFKTITFPVQLTMTKKGKQIVKTNITKLDSEKEELHSFVPNLYYHANKAGSKISFIKIDKSEIILFLRKNKLNKV